RAPRCPLRIGHAVGRRARRRSSPRARDRRRRAPPPLGRVRAVLSRRGDPDLPAGASVCGQVREPGSPCRGAADPDAAGRRRPPDGRGRAAEVRAEGPRPRGAARARAPGVCAERRPGRLRRLVHLAAGGPERPGRGHARRGAGQGPRPRPRDLGRARGRSGGQRGRPGVRRVRAGTAAAVIVRWGLEELPGLLDDVGIERPLLVASDRWDALAIPAPHRWSQVPSDRMAVPPDADGILAVGGGSAIDTAKAASAASGLPLVSVPTTYSGAEWTSVFGVRTPDRRQVGGGSGARPVGIVYDPELTLDLPRAASGGTALNALAHCVEGLYPGELEVARRGAAAIDQWLPRVLDDGRDLEARTRLLEGAANAGEALAEHGLYLGHAMAQAVGGRYGIPHGAANALCL